MKRNSILEINSKKYISSRIACEVWGLSQNTVAKYCRSGRIKNCFKGAHNQWYIPIDTVRPLSDIEIHRLLFLTLQLPTLEIDWSTFDFDTSLIDLIYSNLVFEGYLKPFKINNKESIPYQVILTQKGLNIALPRKSKKADITFPSSIAQWLPTIISAAQLVTQVLQLSMKL